MGSIALHGLAGFSLLVAIIVLWKASREVWQTTLRTAASWAWAGLALWCFAFVLDFFSHSGSAGSRDLLWYLTAVVCVCPPVAVLGARKPGAAAWGFFVLLPLLLVLLWPAAASTRVWRAGVPLELEEPALVAFSVVMVMGCGNYFGTKFTLPSMLFAGAIVLLLAPMSAVAPEMFRHQRDVRAWATMLLAASMVLARLRCVVPLVTGDVWNRVWLDFTDHYGQVWAKRVMDRLNDTARHEQWVAKLEWHGVIWNADASDADRARTLERLDHQMRWLLKRFVEPPWIDSRLGQSTGS